MIGFKRRSRVELPAQIEALRDAVELAEGRLDGEHVAFAQAILLKADARLRHGTTHTLAALLGPTGAGKSSLVNALVGSKVATAGFRRPTTSATLACVWGDDEQVDSSGPLLDWLEVKNRHTVSSLGSAPKGLDGLILLDVPDHDSVEVAHRLEMERIAEHVDLLVWVTDPEKYADASLHGYLRYLAGHEAVTLVILNKADRLAPADLAACRRDLSRLLVEDGIPSATVVAASATTDSGVDELLKLLERAVANQDVMVDRLRADVAVAASELAADAGSGTVGRMTDKAIASLADELVGATGIDAVADAVAAGTKRDAAAVMGWPFTRWARKFRPHPLRRLHLDSTSSGRTSMPAVSRAQTLRAEGSIREFADKLTADMAHPWPGLIRQAGTPEPTLLADRLDRAVGDAVRNHAPGRPRWWSAIGLIQWVLALSAVLGGIWLAALFGLAYLQIPEPPMPEFRGFPIPTMLFLVGAAAGLLLAFLSRRLASITASRAAKRARNAAVENVKVVAEELVVEPVRIELAGRDRLVELLTIAGADERYAADASRTHAAR